MLETLISFDTKLFLLINGNHDPVADFIMFWASNKLIWIPFYAWLLFILYKLFGNRAFLLLPVVAVIITGTDQISVLIKNATERFRPCHEPSIQHIVHLVNNKCGGKFGFVSSHAANSMGLAVFLLGLIPVDYKWVRIEIIAFVMLVGYSRIYLGNHYPGDVICGWVLGIVLGFIASYSVKKYLLKTKMQ